MTVATGTTNAVKVGLSVLREVKVDDDIDSLDVNATSEEVGTHKIAADAVAEVVEYTVSGSLGHLGVTVEAGIAELGDLLGEQFDTIGRVTEDDGLVDLEFREERVQAVDLLLLLDEGVVLGDTAKGELIHQVDLEGCVHVLVGKVLDRDGEGGGEEHQLTVPGVTSEDLLDGLHKLNREQLIGFVHNKHGALAQICNVLPCKICNSARRADKDVDGLTETKNVIPQSGSTSCDHDIDVEVFSECLAHM